MICSSVIQQFISEHLKAIRNCLVSLLYFALWLVEKTRPTFSADWMQKWKNQSRLDHSRFRAPKPISTGPRYWGFSASTSSPAREYNALSHANLSPTRLCSFRIGETRVLQMWIDILAAYCYSLAGEDFNWVQVTNKLLCSAATGWNFTVTVVCCRTALLLLCFVIFEIQTSGILTQLSLLMLLGYNFM